MIDRKFFVGLGISTVLGALSLYISFTNRLIEGGAPLTGVLFLISPLIVNMLLMTFVKDISMKKGFGVGFLILILILIFNVYDQYNQSRYKNINDALTSGKVEPCYKMRESEGVELCLKQVAIRTKNIEICDQISYEFLRGECYSRLQP